MGKELNNSDTMDNGGYVLTTMVAKETNLVEHIDKNMESHKKFCKTQNLAAYLANEFNCCLQATPLRDIKKELLLRFSFYNDLF
jgi:hypothetical protein